MRQLESLLALIVLVISASSGAQAQNPFVGSWAINPPGGFAGWLGVTERDGKLSAQIMWGFGSVVPVDGVAVDGDKLVLTRIQRFTETGADGKRMRKTATETITATRTGDNLALTTITRRDDGAGNPSEESFTGKRLPDMPPAPDLSKVRFGRPIQLLSGKDLMGWRLTDPNAANGWKIVGGVLVNDPMQTPGQPHKSYGNLRTDREFEDFRITLEVNVPKDGNSGVYLRGVYEVQVADTYGQPLNEHNMGAVYSRVRPTAAAEKPAGEWQTMDITLVDRHVTVILNGVKIIDNQPVQGPTGGALWSDPTRPGPIYLQGDHLAVSYRNMVIRPVVRGSR